MSASTFARLREQTMGSVEDEEAVTVNTRALIDKVLARYSGEWTTLRELIQNAADAQAKKVTIRFETLPSAQVPLPQSKLPSALLKHTLQHHTLKTLLVSNDGEVFKETDWQRLKRIAEGNPDETKIGAFGVGFYSVFADCETPFVSSGDQTMAFYWKKDSLFTRRGKLSPAEASAGTTFLLDYRSQSTPIPQLLGLCQFLATSLTFVGLDSIDLFLDDWSILSLSKKMAPEAGVNIPKTITPKTQDGIMKILDVHYQTAQIDATWMNVVAWDRKTVVAPGETLSAPSHADTSGGSLRSWFSKFTAVATASSTTRRLQREEEMLQQGIAEDLAGPSKASVFLRLSTVNVQTNVSRQLAAELERATKKPPPKRTKIAILTSSFDESAASMSSMSGAGAKKAQEIFASVLPNKNGKIFIGFPTAQTTGLLAHISAPSVIPTVERENIDLNARYVRDWNIEMLRVAGIACRIAYTGEMASFKERLDRAAANSGTKAISKDHLSEVMPGAIHAYNQYSFEESTPSSRVGQYIEEAFWMCSQNASIDLLSTRGILPSNQVRVATEDLSFVEGIPVVPDELLNKANKFLTKLREFGLLLDITTSDIKKELEAQALSEHQVVELVKWACGKVSRAELDGGAIRMLFDGTIATVSEENLKHSDSPVIQLGRIETFVNTARFPADMPMPPQTIPFRLTKGLPIPQLAMLGWEEAQIVPWLRWIVETDGRAFGPDKSLTQTPSVAAQILPVISKAWDGLSVSSRQTVVDLLSSRTVIPTKLGMQVPSRAYFASVKLFDDLPTITGLQNVKEKFLAALGVRKTVELSVVFDRLMSKSASASTDGKWSHVDLIKYLLSVKDDIPQEDLKRLRSTPICTAEVKSADQAEKDKLYCLSDLYEPSEALRKLGLPVLLWPPPWRPASPECQFLRSLGLQQIPTVPVIVDILSKAPSNSELQQNAIAYFITQHFQNGYNKFSMSSIDKAFLPVLPFAGEGNNMIAKPSQCFANPGASVLRFRTLRQDLQPHHTMFGVALDPPIEAAADRLIKTPPLDTSSAKILFGYFSDRLNEIGPSSTLADRLGNAPIVPIVGVSTSEKRIPPVRFVTPRNCFLGDNETYGDIFDFVDFGPEANSFLLRIGSKHEPSAIELAGMLVQQPARLLDRLGTEKYLQLLRKIATQVALLRKDRGLWQTLKTSSCLLGIKIIPKQAPPQDATDEDMDEDDLVVKEVSLSPASKMVIVDDFPAYRLFQSILLTAPQETQLEEFYAALETPYLGQLIQDDCRMGAELNDQKNAPKLQRLLVERGRLFLHDHTADVVRHDAKWLEQNLTVKFVEFLQLTRTLKLYNKKYTENKSALLHRPSKNAATLYVTPKYDLYEVSRAVMSLLLKKPKQQDYLALETILASDLRRLKMKGYNVERILRQQAVEMRIAASERQKREEEQERLREANASRNAASAQNGTDNTRSSITAPSERSKTPEKPLAMPGSFADSPEQSLTANRGKKSGGLFSNIRQQLGLSGGNDSTGQMENMLSHNQADDVPPPYEPRDPRLTSGAEPVTSPKALQQNLESAISKSRAYNSSTLFSPGETNRIKETPSYCDTKPAQDLKMVAELQSGIKFFLRRNHPDPNGFLQSNREGLALFVWLLSECGALFGLPTNTLNVFYDDSGASIAFNSQGSLFCNLRYFLQLHMAHMSSADGKVEAMSYWWITLCHELAHNLVSDHSAAHSFYTESFAAHYFRRVLWWSGRQTNSS